jgi:hypothetical protein
MARWHQRENKTNAEIVYIYKQQAKSYKTIAYVQLILTIIIAILYFKK